VKQQLTIPELEAHILKLEANIQEQIKQKKRCELALNTLRDYEYWEERTKVNELSFGNLPI